MRRRTAVVWLDGRRKRVSRSTLHRWIAAWQKDGFQGLMPKQRDDVGETRVGDTAHIDFAVGLLLEQPTRSLQQVDIYLRQQFTGYQLSLATLRRRLRDHTAYAAIEAARGNKPPALRDRYEAQHPHESWQLDGKGPFPVHLVSGDVNVRVHVLTVIDDHSRAVLAPHVAKSEDAKAAITVFQKAAARYGLPERMQFDRGSAFDSNEFRDGIAQCGVHRNYVRARHPQAQGKIEAYHRSLQRWFIDELQAQEVRDLEHLQDLLEATIAVVYQRHHHRGIRMTPFARLGDRVSSRRLSESELARAFYVAVEAQSDTKTGEVKLPNGVFRVPTAHAGERQMFRYDPIRPAAVLVTRDRRELELEPFVVKRLPDAAPREPAHGNGRLQKILDTWRGRAIANAEPAFGLPEVFAALATALGRAMPASDREATQVQGFWREHGPMRRAAFLRACQSATDRLGAQRPIAVLLADIARQIEDDEKGSAGVEVLV
jgi:transposase InsO family protein